VRRSRVSIVNIFAADTDTENTSLNILNVSMLCLTHLNDDYAGSLWQALCVH